MTDLPAEIQVWRNNDALDHIGAWATTRYPAEAVTYVRKADVQAALALVVEKAAETVKSLWKFDDEGWQIERPSQPQAEAAIRALAPVDGLAMVEALRLRASAARWNVDEDGRLVRLCRGDHEKGERCEEHAEVFVPVADLAAAKAQIEALRDLVETAGRARLIIDTAFLEMGETVNYAPSVIAEVCDMLEPHSALAALPAKEG